MSIRSGIYNLVFIMLFPTVSFAQMTILDNTEFTIKENQEVSIIGYLFNRSSAFLNQGNLILKGNFWNEASVLNPGKGIIRFNGEIEQILFLFDTLEVFDIEIDNPIGLTLQGNQHLNIFSNMNFWNGVVNTNSGSMLFFQQGAGHNNASDISHINGPVLKYGISDFIFPVGKNGVMREAGISNLTGYGTFIAEYFDYGYFTLESDETLYRVNDQEYWEINRILGNVDAKVGLTYDENSSIFADPDNLKIAYFHNPLWTKVEALSGGGSPFAYLTSQSRVNQFGFFTTADINFPDIDIAAFKAFQNEECIIELEWLMPPETFLSHYEVQRSLDSLNYVTIGVVSGDSLPLTDYKIYQYNDSGFFNERNIYYRLKMIRPDSAFTYSYIVVVENKCIFEDCQIFPNPLWASDNLKIRIQSEEAREMPIQIYDVPGRLIHQEILELDAGRHEYEIATKSLDLPASTYFLYISPQKNFKFVVIR